MAHCWRVMTETITTILARVRDELTRAGFADAAAREARYILHACGIDDTAILADGARGVTADRIAQIEKVAARRAGREPLSRIRGVREFYGLNFHLNDATLDPRPDTEILVQGAIEWAQARPRSVLRMLDLGTGTGCIPIAILKHLPDLCAVAVDVAPDAIVAASENARLNGVEGRMTVLQSSWADGVTGTFDLITSNPPYIPSGDIPNLDPEVTNHDPILALDGGGDGFVAHRNVLIAIKKHLEGTGLALIEMGAGQLADMRETVIEYGLDVDRIYMDYAGIPRVIGVCHLSE